MFLSIQELIAKAKLKGVAVNIHARGEDQLNVVITPQLPDASDTAHLKDGDDANQYFSLREALSSPLVFTGSPDELSADIGQFIDALSPSAERASQTMTATAQSAKLDAVNATAKASSKTAKSSKKGAKAKKAEAPDMQKEPQQTSPAGADTKSVEPKTTETKPNDTFADFDNLDSI